MKKLPSILSLCFIILLSVNTNAATNLNSSRSNIYRLNPNDPNAVTKCIKSGGTVSTKNGQKLCVINNIK